MIIINSNWSFQVPKDGKFDYLLYFDNYESITTMKITFLYVCYAMIIQKIEKIWPISSYDYRQNHVILNGYILY